MIRQVTLARWEARALPTGELREERRRLEDASSLNTPAEAARLIAIRAELRARTRKERKAT